MYTQYLLHGKYGQYKQIHEQKKKFKWVSKAKRTLQKKTDKEQNIYKKKIPVWIPSGSKFSILQTVTQLSATSLTTSYSTSFQPSSDFSTRIWLLMARACTVHRKEIVYTADATCHYPLFNGWSTNIKKDLTQNNPFLPCEPFSPAFFCLHTVQSPGLQGHKQIVALLGSQSALQLSKHRIPERLTYFIVKHVDVRKHSENNNSNTVTSGTHRLHSNTGCNLFIDLIQFISKKLSVLSGHDGLHWGSQHFDSILVQYTLLK